MTKKISIYTISLGNDNDEKLLNVSSDFPSTSSILEPGL